MRAGACHDRPWLVTTTTIAAAASRPPPLSTCTQAAAVHGTMHKLEDLGIVTSGARSRGFDGKVGLAQIFTNATKPLGKAFSLAKTHKHLDSAVAARDAERLILFCYHGNHEDICSINERILTGSLKTLAGAKGRGGFELIGHYVVLDTSLGILYLEPEVYIISEAERRDPSLLRDALMCPPYQLLFERGTAASSHARTLMLSVRTPASLDSNYGNPALLKRTRAEYVKEQQEQQRHRR